MSHPNDGKLYPQLEAKHLTMQKLKEWNEQIEAGLLSVTSSICGEVNYPICDFIELLQMVFPQLYVEIGFVNNVLVSFYLFIDDRVEVPTDEEKCS
jgi:hypothetical protein